MQTQSIKTSLDFDYFGKKLNFNIANSLQSAIVIELINYKRFI